MSREAFEAVKWKGQNGKQHAFDIVAHEMKMLDSKAASNGTSASDHGQSPLYESEGAPEITGRHLKSSRFRPRTFAVRSMVSSRLAPEKTTGYPSSDLGIWQTD
jgi:hypothetical protein